VLLGAPTGSGKTISSELTMMRLWEAHPGDKVRAGAAVCRCFFGGADKVKTFVCADRWIASTTVT